MPSPFTRPVIRQGMAGKERLVTNGPVKPVHACERIDGQQELDGQQEHFAQQADFP